MMMNGHSEKMLRTIEPNSVDCIVTDPPYGISMFQMSWDKVLPSKKIWSECLRVLKPGAFAFIMCASRSNLIAHLVLDLEEVGFNTNFTPIYWSFSTGFPKSHNISKSLKKKGIDRPDLEGSYSGFQVKPSVEVVLVVMKPLDQKTYTEQALKNSKGVTWLDNARIPAEKIKGFSIKSNSGFPGDHEATWDDMQKERDYESDERGRFPANLIVGDQSLEDHSKYFNLDAWFNERIVKNIPSDMKSFPFLITPKPSVSEKNLGLEGMEKGEPAVYNFRPTLKSNPENWKKGIQDMPYGGANRSGKSVNSHPSIKPIKLMSWLITLGSQKGNTILDPFIGSGTTAIACVLSDRKYIGVELDREYFEIAMRRLSYYEKQIKPKNKDVRSGL